MQRDLFGPSVRRSGLWLMLGMLLTAAFALSSADPAHALPRLTQCGNHLDDDGDGKVDFPEAPGCTRRGDAIEAGPTTLCSDGADSDADLLIDYPNDPGCTSASDNDETNPAVLPQCSDGADNEFPMDGTDYPADPGCIAASDDSEDDTACSNGGDDDGDKLVDFPADWGCTAPSIGPNQADASEVDPPQCNDGVDNDGDTWLDANTNIPGQTKDPGCTDLNDTSESPNPQCSDAVDNDKDGKIDFPADPGCTSREDDAELDSVPAPPPPPAPLPACSDTFDNDNDGKIDFPADAGCVSRQDTDETDLGAPTAPPGSGARPPVASSTVAAAFPPITPFPVVRLRGKADRRGVTISLLRVQAPNGSKITIYCHGRRCPLHKKSQITTSGAVRVRRFERRLRAGSTLVIYVTKSGFTGKYTRFRIRTGGRSPSRFDGCARFTGQKPVPCPAN